MSPEQNAERVRVLSCRRCPVTWTFEPPQWLGEPWTREQAVRLMKDHLKLAHPDLNDESECAPNTEERS